MMSFETWVGRLRVFENRVKKTIRNNENEIEIQWDELPKKLANWDLKS